MMQAMNLPSLDSLLCFEAVARELSFREAARTVCLTPAAVSQRIKQLEEQLGTELFKRTSRSVQLTDAGLSLLPAARACIEAAQSCVESVRSDAGPPPQEITLGATYEIGLSWVTPSLRSLAEVLPRVTIHLHLGPAPDLLVRLKSKEIDVAVTSYAVPDPSYATIDLKEERYVFVASPELLARTPFARPEDSALHTLLDVRSSLPMFRRMADAMSTRLEFAGVRCLGSTEAVRRLVREGAGVAVLPTYLIASELEAKQMQVLMPEAIIPPGWFRLVVLADDTRRSLHEAMSVVLARAPLADSDIPKVRSPL